MYIYTSNQCPDCGGEIIGDGYSSVMHCENADETSYEYHEPDASPVYCGFKDTVPTNIPVQTILSIDSYCQYVTRMYIRHNLSVGEYFFRYSMAATSCHRQQFINLLFKLEAMDTSDDCIKYYLSGEYDDLFNLIDKTFPQFLDLI